MVRSTSCKTLHIEYTDGCNSRCRMCDYWKIQTPKTIDNALLYKNIVMLIPQGLKTVYFSGGECLVVADQLLPLVEKLHKEYPSLKLKLNTNGILLKKYAEQIGNIFSTVIISLDTVDPKIYRQIRGIDGLKTIMQGIQLLHRQSPSVAINLRCLVLPENIDDLKAIIDFAIENELTKISFIPEDTSSTTSFGRNDEFCHNSHISDADYKHLCCIVDEIKCEYSAQMGNLLSRNGADFDYILKVYSGTEGITLPCDKAKCSCVIGADLRVSPCFFVPGEQYLPSGKSVQDILCSDAHQKVITQIYSTENSPCAQCVCPKILS